MQQDPTIVCPNCKTDIKLNESLAAPLIESTKRAYEQKLATKDEEIERQEMAIRERELTLKKAQSELDERVDGKVREELPKIAAEEARKAKLAMGSELEQQAKTVADLEGILKEKDVKLADAQKAQADFLQKQRELDDAMRELNVTVEKRVRGGLTEARDQGKKEAEDELKLTLAESEHTISTMRTQIDELKKKAEQGSQQLQGEVQELQLETLLLAQIPRDTIEPVPKGEFGGDILHRVCGAAEQPCGTILWESKRTKGWSDGWLAKLREDQRTAKAELCVIVSQSLPKGVETFELIDGVWVTHPRAAIPVAISLRQTLIEVSAARIASDGQHTKMEMVYQYLTGPRFRQRVEAIVEAFSSMKEDLDKERKAITKQWAKREEQVLRVMTATVGMYGDMQGIAGKSLSEIDGLDLQQLEAPEFVVE